MKAFVHVGVQGLAGTQFRDMEEIIPVEGEVQVKLNYAGLNHRDLLVMRLLLIPVYIGKRKQMRHQRVFKF